MAGSGVEFGFGFWDLGVPVRRLYSGGRGFEDPDEDDETVERGSVTFVRDC